MIDDITSFLPAYPNIYPTNNEIFDPYKKNFYETLYSKKEFYEQRLDATEAIPSIPGTLTKQQTLISRLFAGYTPYDAMLLVHEMGCVDPMTRIPLFNGSVKYAREIQAGDFLVGDDGASRKVMSTMEGISEMYKISQTTGESYTVNEEHVLTLIIPNNFQIIHADNELALQWFDKKTYSILTKKIRCDDISTQEAYKYLENFKNNIFYSDAVDIPLAAYVKLPESTRQLLKGYKSTSNEYSDITITYVGRGRFIGWTLDTLSNQRFILADGTVTHNSGKTCVAVGAAEAIRNEKNGLGKSFKGVLYLAKNKELLENFVNELIFKCTDGRYIPENYKDLNEQAKKIRKNKEINDYYNTNTFETFSKKLQTMNDASQKREYNNYVIIIDEVHHLRENDNPENIKTYDVLYKFLHTVENCKILLMSGTPMRNTIDEIASIMNLMLPEDTQLPTGNEFINTFFNTYGENLHIIKREKADELKNVFKGKVSFVKAMQSDVKKLFVGEKYGALKHYKVKVDTMSQHQTESYKKALIIDSESKAFHSESVQAALFVYPNGTYKNDGFKDYIVTNKTAKNKVVGYTYKLSPKLFNVIYAPTHEGMLQNIAKFSSKYAASIRNILKARDEGKSYFVYNRFVHGSGLILFSLLLELFGFTKATGFEKEGDARSRYASTIKSASSNIQLGHLIERFNQPDNKNGRIIQVIMGTQKISEGFTLKNVLVEDIHTPWHNYAETEQALARGIRFGSHKDLINSGLTNPVVEIFQRVSIPDDPTIPSVDLMMYERSELKDISIKGVERLLKESAIDCAETYNRNFISGFDGKRLCEYQKCEYTCDGIPTEKMQKLQENLDKSTYNIYYSQSNTLKIIEFIKKRFRKDFRIEFGTIIDNLPDKITEHEILLALHTIINQSIPIINKYGFVSYLQEENNSYFLVDSLSISGKFKSDYYTEYPHIHENITFAEIINPIYISTFPVAIENLFASNTIDDINKYLLKLPLDVKEFILESCILADIQEKKENFLSRNMILAYYENYYTKFDDTWISWLLHDDQGIVKCLRPGTTEWTSCESEFGQTIEELKRNRVRELEKSEFGYYGLYNRETKEFCIRNVTEENPDKKNKQTTGKRCVNWNRTNLINLAINVLNMPIPTELDAKTAEKWKKLNSNDIKTLIETIRESKYLDDLYENQPLINTPVNELKRVLFWGTMMVPSLCQYIEAFFKSLGPSYYVEDNTCGTSAKVKL